jgi:acyl-coenzyme A thioesterase PaaI-like protein
MRSPVRSRMAAGGSNLTAGGSDPAAGGSNAARSSSTRARSGALSGRPTAQAVAADIDRARIGRFQYRPHNCFACGQLNSGGLQLALHVDGTRCWTEFEIPQRFEGWQGMAHGGILSTIVDEVMAWSLVAVDHVGVTTRLEVDFRGPALVGRPIRAEGWIVQQRRRRFDTAAVVVDRDSGETLVEARAIYLAADPNRSREIREQYGFTVTAEPDPAEAPTVSQGLNTGGAVAR